MIYEGYSTAEEFDAGYSNSITPEVVEKWEVIFRHDSERVLANSPTRRELRYGTKERNAIDFFPAMGAPSHAPVLIAIHGGLWFLFDKWLMHFLAEAFTRHGVHVACLNYGLAPGQGLGAIIGDCRQAVAYLFREAESLGIDQTRLSVLGHSASGQICALMAGTDWTEDLPEIAVPKLHSCIGVSGFYDIEPFAQTHFHAFTQFQEEDYRKWNPLRRVHPAFAEMLLITGGRESSLIQQMTQHFATALRGASVPVQTLCAAGECHFSVLHEIGNPQSPLFERVMAALH